MLCDPVDCSTPGLPVYHQLLEFTQTQVHRFGDAIQPCHPLSSPSLPPSIFSSVRVFCSASVLHHQVAKVLEFQLQPPDVFLELSCCSHDPADVGNLISGSSAFSKTSLNISEYSGLISFRMDWLDLLAVQGTLKSLLQHRSSKASVLWCSAFFMVQL